MTRSVRSMLGFLLLAAVAVGCGDDDPTGPDPIEPGEGTIAANITANRTLYKDTVYTISGFIKVTDGATLTIQPGTRILGDFDVPGSSLFILRGARIIANGTAEEPIVFTSSRAQGQRQPGDWGGIVIVGRGIINRGDPTNIEGTGSGPENPLENYAGGTNNADNSGTLRYVRIEFAGFPIASNNELNALTMAAVGSGTTIEYVQVLLGLDDSFEWFGGAVNARYLVSYEAGDDHFDMSEGYVGRIQNVIAFQSFQPEPRPGLSGSVATDPQGIENDGCAAANCSNAAVQDNSLPYTIPVVANFTVIGAPQGSWETTGGNIGMMIRRGVGGLYVNGVVARQSRAGISFRGDNTNTRMTEGNLALRNIYVSEIVNNTTFQAGAAPGTGANAQYLPDLTANAITAGTATATSLFTALPANTVTATAASFDWRPAASSPIATGGLATFTTLPAALQTAAAGVLGTAYRGAADPAGPQWWAGWTYYSRN